ncbi:hypothetical protein Ancab_006494 [Ancistrocladus abbreviatus]
MPNPLMEDNFYLPHHHHQQQPNFAKDHPDHHHCRYPAPPECTTPDESPSSSSPSPSIVFLPDAAPLSPPVLYDNVSSRFRSAILSPLYCSESGLEISGSQTAHVPHSHAADDFNFGCEVEKDGEQEGEYDDEGNFVTNLFERGSEGQNSDLSLVLGMDVDQFPEDMDYSDYLDCGMVGEIDGIDESNELDLELGLGFEDPQLTVHEEEEEPCCFGGLRIVAIDSDSDSEQNAILDFQYASDADNSDRSERFGGISDFERPLSSWDYLGFNDQTSNSDNFDWEEADDNEYDYDREIDVSSVVSHNDEDDFLFDQYEDGNDDDSGEILILSDTDEEREFRDDLEGVEEFEWDAMSMEAEENLHELTGNPPAAKSIVESLPGVRLHREDLGENEIVCAICEDEFLLEETVRQLPCGHYYHGDCVLPWLKIRNTCPVCRYELPTDDPEYEFRKRKWIEQNVSDLPQDAEIGYDFHVFWW